MDDPQLLEHLNQLYHERTICTWCRHPKLTKLTRGLCSHCYRIALRYWKMRTLADAIAISFALNEGTRNAADWPVDGLAIEQLFESVAGMVFPWKSRTANPFWHTANIWGESFSEPQRRLLFHYFSLPERAVRRRERSARAWAVVEEIGAKDNKVEINEYITKADDAVNAVFAK